MSVPTHGPDCQARMFPTACPDCGDAVFFFSCTCGSRVFFDKPGAPWPCHQDRCIPYLIRVLRDVEHVPLGIIKTRVEREASLRGCEVPQGIWADLEARTKEERRQATILEIVPTAGEVALEGQLLSANMQVNFFKRFNLDDNSIGRGLLGKLAKEGYCELVLRSVMDPDTHFVNQFTFFIPTKLYHILGLHMGVQVGCILRMHEVPTRPPIWLANDILRLD